MLDKFSYLLLLSFSPSLSNPTDNSSSKVGKISPQNKIINPDAMPGSDDGEEHSVPLPILTRSSLASL